ncbi:hypothetical protein C8J57DRAFT_1506122 [Mycena rebaudengoi]|nr:hypothetical protein C8J57DRAFT_1506122 [Mycena rebaudengoi]
MLPFTTSTVLISLLSILNGAPSAVAFGPARVNLRTAGNFAILSKAGVSTVSPSSINADVGVSPIAATGLTGFSLTLDSTDTSYSCSLTVVISDLVTVFNDANGRINPNFTNLASALGGLTLVPGLYKWTGAVFSCFRFHHFWNFH